MRALLPHVLMGLQFSRCKEEGRQISELVIKCCFGTGEGHKVVSIFSGVYRFFFVVSL